MPTNNLNRTAFVGGKVWTPGFAAPRSLDVMVEDERIADVTVAGALDTRAADIVDLTGKLLAPGFQDAHIHMGIGGQDLLTCDLSGLETPEEVYSAIALYASRHPDLAWVTGGGWNRDVFDGHGPTRQKLDELVDGRPAVFSPYDRHGAWVSTAALTAAGVHNGSPDPLHGFFQRDHNGDLTGMVEEDAVAVVRRAMPELSTRDRMKFILKAQDHVLQMGITSVQDALVGEGLGMPDQLEAYREVLKDGSLRLRLTTALWWDQTRGLEQIPEIQQRRKQLEDAAEADRVIADTVKMMVDGSNLLFMTAEQIREATVALDALGFTVHYHSFGDGTTRWILDAIEAAIEENGPKPRRHHIAHLFVVGPTDFERFAKLGVTANVQGFWAGSSVPHDHLHQSTLIEHPERFEYPLGRLQAAGARLAAGSDWPVTTPDPLACAGAAGGNSHYLDSTANISELDRLDLATMLTAYTSGSAFVNGRDGRTGRIARGLLADLVVLDRDIFEHEQALIQASVVEVWIGGHREYSRA